MEKIIRPNIRRSILPGVLFSIIFFIVFFFVISFLGSLNAFLSPWIFLFFIFILLSYLVMLVLKYQNLKNTQFIVNKNSVSYKQTFLSEDYIDIPTSQITNITYSIGFIWDKIFNTGRINFFTSGGSFYDLSFFNIAGVEDLYEDISSILKLSKSRKISKEGEFSDSSKTDGGLFLRRVKPDVKTVLIFNLVSSLVIFPLFLMSVGIGLFAALYSILEGSSFMVYIFIFGMILVIGIYVLSLYLIYKRYKRIYYDFYTDKLEYYDGFLTLNKVTIPLERITNIDSNQNFWDRIFGIYTIEIETAGSSGSEITINYIKDGPGVVKYLKEVLHKHGRN